MTRPRPRRQAPRCPRCGCAEIERIRTPLPPVPGRPDRHGKARPHIVRDRCLRCAWPDSLASEGARRLGKTAAVLHIAPRHAIILVSDDGHRRHAELLAREIGRADLRIMLCERKDT